MKRKILKNAFAILICIAVLAVSVMSAFSVFGTDTDSTDPEWAGTEEKGVVVATSSSSSMNNVGTSVGLLNGDFEKGLKYWGTTVKSTNAGADLSGSIVTEANGNKYFQLSGNFESQWSGIKSCAIAIPKANVDTTAKYVLMLDVKGDETWQACLDTRFMTDGKGCTASRSTCTEIAVNGDWATYITPECTLAGSTYTGSETYGTAAGDYVVYVRLNCNSDVTSKAGFDNLRIAKVSGSKYYDVFTGEEIVVTSTSTDSGSGSVTGSGTNTGTGNGTGANTGSGTSATTGENVMLLAALLLLSGAGILVTGRSIKSR